MLKLFEETYHHRHTDYVLLSKEGSFLDVYSSAGNEYENFSFMRFYIYKKTLYLEEIFIKDSDRKKGYGSEFIKYLEDNYDINRIILEMDTSWAKMSESELTSFYNKNGFIRYHDFEFRKQIQRD